MRKSIIMPVGTKWGGTTSVLTVQIFDDTIFSLFISGTVTVNIGVSGSFTAATYDAVDVGSAQRIIQQINNAMNSSGDMSVSIVDAASPALPTGLTGTPAVFQADLSWDVVSPADNYVIYRSLVSGGPYTQIGTAVPNFFNNPNLSAGVTYFYVITVMANGIESAYSAEVSVTPASGALSPLIPVMTSNTTPSGVASASSEMAGREAWYAFDGTGVPWVGLTMPVWLQYQFASAQTATFYELFEWTGGQTIEDWTLEGSNDGSTWTQIDIQSDFVWPVGQHATIPITSPGSYIYYRLNITALNGPHTPEVSILQLYG